MKPKRGLRNDIERAVKLFTQGEISIGRAALLAGMSRETFMSHLGQLGIPVINSEPSDLDAELDAAGCQPQPTTFKK